MKNSILIIIIMMFSLINIFSQKNDSMLTDKYTGDVIRFFSDKRDKIKVKYLKTDTISGFEIKIVISSKENNFTFQNYCSVYFTVADIYDYSNIVELFSKEIISNQNDNNFNPCYFVAKADTFIYNIQYSGFDSSIRKKREYFYKLLFTDSINDFKTKYVISPKEYFYVNEINAIVDVFTGGENEMHFFYPMMENVIFNKDSIIYYKYRKVLMRKNINKRIMLGVKKCNKLREKQIIIF